METPRLERRRGTLERPGCQVYYEVTGSRRPAIVFAHGLGGNHMSWWQQVAHFAPRYTCVTFAHRGFAPSSPIPGGPDPADYAGDLAALVAELGLWDVRVVAQSMGGWTAVEYALRRPPELRGVVLGATTGSLDPRHLPEPWRTQVAEWTEWSRKEAATMAEAGVHPAAGFRMAAEQPAMHLLYHQINDANAALDKEALRQRLFANRKRDPGDLAGVACPVLMIANEEDAAIPPMAAEGIAAVVPAIRTARIAAAGHSAYFERPAEYNAVLDGFFRSLGD